MNLTTYTPYRLCCIFVLFLRQPVTILLLIAFTAQAFTASFIRLDYFVNTAAYAKNCINKARPKMRCNGQCQAMKKIEAQQRKDQQDSERKYENKEKVFSSGAFNVLITPGQTAWIRKTYTTMDEKTINSIPRACFHPPNV